LNKAALDWRILAAAGAAAVVGFGVVASRWLRRPPNPDETERKRRLHLNQIGRIVEGHIIEVMQVDRHAQTEGASARQSAGASLASAVADGHRKLVCYSYSISGVSYETAQDVTGLEERVRVEHLVAGQPASVKYDPSNPSDSILVADDWSGVR